MSGKILVVDDSATDRMMISNILCDYCLLSAKDGLEAMSILKSESEIDLMILDLNMPNMTGFEVLEQIRENPILKKISVLILTNYNEVENEIKGLNLGALDYIRKPLNLESLRKRIEVHINLRTAQKKLEEHNIMLERAVEERTREIAVTRDITIRALVGLLEVRNVEASNHTKRTQWMMQELCGHLIKKGLYSDLLTKSYAQSIFDAAPLHDIGKVGIPDYILLKPGRLSVEEFTIMKKHAEYGVMALKYASEAAHMSSFINAALEIVGTHHEKYDGGGYPNGLKGEEIPLPGRLMAIIDVYDALVSKRVYKPPFSHEEAMKMIAEEKGKHFDPIIVDAFIEIQDKIKDIGNRFNQNPMEREN